MKIIEAMKRIKELQRKAADLRDKINTHCEILDPIENPTYPDQRAKIASWLQAHEDVVEEILGLKIAIQRTNLATEVPIEIGGKVVRKTIAEWIHRRGAGSNRAAALSKLDLQAWSALDKKLREGTINTSSKESVQVKIRRFYDPETRDARREVYTSEPSMIDATLEVVNATTDLVEDVVPAEV